MPSPVAPQLVSIDALPLLAWGLIGAALLGVAMAALAPHVLRALPEPLHDPEAPRYSSLATPGFIVTTAALTALGSAVVVWRADPALWLAWSSLTTVNVLACAIDARTTWLPARLSWAGWTLAALGMLAAGVAAWSWLPVVAGLVGALIVGGFFHAVWRLSGQLGYGDVRLATTVGAVTALSSPALALWALLAGTLLGALTGLVLRACGRVGGFPYGPGLLTGAFVALLLPWV